jgi:hypothetical protein
MYVEVFFIFVYIFVVVENPIVNRGKIGIPLTGSTLPHVTACPKP